MRYYPCRYTIHIYFFLIEIRSFYVLAENRKIYLFFSSFLSFIRHNLVSPAPGGWDWAKKKEKIVLYSNRIFKTDYYLYSIEWYTLLLRLHLKPYVFCKCFRFPVFWYSVCDITKFHFAGGIKSFFFFRASCWFLYIFTFSATQFQALKLRCAYTCRV